MSEAPAALHKGLSLLWVGCGTEDQLFRGTRTLHESLTTHGAKHTYRTKVGPADHPKRHSPQGTPSDAKSSSE